MLLFRNWLNTVCYFSCQKIFLNCDLQDCGLIAMKIPCYATYILHRIGTTNLTLATDLAKSYLSDWAKNPFLKIKTDLTLTGTLIPGEKAFVSFANRVLVAPVMTIHVFVYYSDKMGLTIRVELLPRFKFTGKTVKITKFTDNYR